MTESAGALENLQQSWQAGAQTGEAPDTQQMREAETMGNTLAAVQDLIATKMDELQSELDTSEGEDVDQGDVQELKTELQQLQSMFESMQRMFTNYIDSKSAADQQRFR